MKKLTLFLLLYTFISGSSLHAQDTLPKFVVKNVGNNRIIIGWVNNFSNIRQISIQRSFDSLSGYKTILTVPDPTTPQNGYVDAKATNDHMFYRIYILLERGVFVFSEAKRPVVDSASRTGYQVLPGLTGIDSVRSPFVNGNKPRSTTFMPSLYVYTNRDGYVRITLPDEEKPKKYSIRFFDDNETFLFELKEIKEKDFKIDKTN
ncbi:MAG TPA: hypothetical protein VGO58_17400, partial [Chitinophagaceae bacterium]|nr:hypothetical protein [Chitinophagaceae bacterium]